MDPLFEPREFARNPEIIETLLAQARRERAEAMYRLLLAPIERLFRRLRAQLHSRPASPIRG